MPKVSIITPIYNGACYIGEAIESVLAQTWQDWELIVIDDGSTDVTPDILKRYTDPRIITIRQENQGAAVARNAGLDRARGEYIALLDADDVYLPTALADFLAYLDDHAGVDVVYSDGIMCTADKKPLMRLSEIRPGIYTGHILEQVVLSTSVITVPVCTMTRHCAIDANHVRFDGDVVPAEDSYFWIDLARYVQFGYLPKLTCMYRIHETNISRTTGRLKRKESRVRGRLKILNAGWFKDLSTATKRQFFYDLLVGLLSGESSRQEEILHSGPFLSLPAPQRAQILRLVASDCLLSQKESDFARRCLEEAWDTSPEDGKSRALLTLLKIEPRLCSAVLSIWRLVHMAWGALCSIGRRKPRPVPASLDPMAD